MSLLKKYFDCVYLITTKNDNNTRKQNFINQINELNLYDDITFYYYENNNTYNFNLCQKFKLPNRKREISCAISHYECILDALNNDYDHILIFEDDVYFLNNIIKIKDLLNNMPNNYDLIRFSYPIISNNTEQYIKINSGNKCCAACYALSKNAIKAYVENQNSLFNCADHFDLILSPTKFNVYFSTVWLAFPFDDLNQLHSWLLINTAPYLNIQTRNYFNTNIKLYSSIWDNNKNII